MTLEEYTKELETRYQQTMDFKDQRDKFLDNFEKQKKKFAFNPFIKTEIYRYHFKEWIEKERYLLPYDFKKLTSYITVNALNLVLKHLGVTAT
ncbi:MAG: hypothetical protein KJI71_01265 [Patescibacteria group bacterium]|nr:hypothetical protein [Patescibacteria group bacterium]